MPFSPWSWVQRLASSLARTVLRPPPAVFPSEVSAPRGLAKLMWRKRRASGLATPALAAPPRVARSGLASARLSSALETTAGDVVVLDDVFGASLLKHLGEAISAQPKSRSGRRKEREAGGGAPLLPDIVCVAVEKIFGRRACCWYWHDR